MADRPLGGVAAPLHIRPIKQHAGPRDRLEGSVRVLNCAIFMRLRLGRMLKRDPRNGKTGPAHRGDADMPAFLPSSEVQSETARQRNSEMQPRLGHVVNWRQRHLLEAS